MAKPKPKPGTTGDKGPMQNPLDLDSPWKEALDRWFEPCIAFFFPLAHADIEWSRSFELLNKELQKIVPIAMQCRRFVDKLAKVWLKNGEERWILIHIEVQTQREGDFPKRMYVYNYRLFDRYDREVISLAILADENPNWRTRQYGYGRWDFRMGIEFPIVKLLDYGHRWQDLEADPNPFATVVLAHLKTQETRRDLAERRAWKVRLVKGLYERGLAAEEVRQSFRFVDWIMDLPKPLDKLFWEEIDQFQEVKGMPFITTPERIGMEKGLLKGIEACLQLKFGSEGLELMPEIRTLEDNEQLQVVLDAIQAASSPKMLRQAWTPKRGSRKPRRA